MWRRFFFFIAAVLLLGLVALGWYVSNKGFTRKWRVYIVKEFHKAGVEVQIPRLTLDPFRGLVAKNVSVIDAQDHKRVIAWIDEILIGVNYANALRGQTFLDSADLRDANLWLPLDPKNPDGPKVEITKLNARFFLPPEQIYLARAQADVHGIQVFATGRVIHPQLLQPRMEGENPILDTGTQILAELQRLRYTGPAPTLTVEFSGDLARPDQMQVDVQFAARNIRRKNYELRNVNLVGSCRDGIVELRQLRAADAYGELKATGTYSLQSGETAGHLTSTLHIGELNRAYGLPDAFDDWALTERPDLTINLQGGTNDRPLQITGHLEVQGATYRRVPMDRLATDFSWEPGGWSLRDFHLTHGSGALSGDLVCQPGNFRLRCSSSINPLLLGPLLKTDVDGWLNRFDFADPPSIQLDLQGTQPALNTCNGTGKIKHEGSLYQGTPVAPATSEIELKHGIMAITPFTFLSDPGETTLLLDFPHHELRFQKASPETKPDGDHQD